MKKFFSYKTHFVFLVIVASAVSSVAMLMKSTSGLEQSRQVQLRSETIQKMNPFKRIVSFKIEEIKSELVSFALNRKTQSPLNLGIFNSISLIQSTGSEYAPKWTEANLKEVLWTREYQAAALKSLPFQKVDGSGFAWFKFQEGTGKPIYMTLIEIEAHRKNQNKKAYIVGMSAQNPLVGVADDYRGTSGKVYLVNDKAFVAAHTNKNYDGVSFSADPVYLDLKNSKRAMSSGSFVDLSGDSIFAYYEKIEHSNLYAVVASPKSSLKAASSQQWQAGFPTLLGMVGLFAFIAFFFAQKILVTTPAAPVTRTNADETDLDGIDNQDSVESEFESLERKKLEAKSLRNELMRKGLASINPFAQMAPTPVVKLNTAPVTKAENNEKVFELLKMMSRGLNKIFSDRISGIIAESSLILAKTDSEDIISHAKLIQSESRKSRELLRELEQYNSERPIEMTKVNLAEVCEHAISKFSDELELEGIEVKKDFDSAIQVKASIERLQQAIEKIIQNSIEALKGRDEKMLAFKILMAGDQAELSISDTGIGMPKEIQDKIFLPFYRDFSSVDGNGLGLSFVQGAVQAMQGQVRVQSSPGSGTEMTLQFGVEKALPVTFETSKENHYEALKNPQLNLDFLGDMPDEAKTDKSYFELGEADLDQEFDEHLKKLSDKIIQKKAKLSKVDEAPPEFNVLADFESEDEDIDDFKVLIREPRSKPLV